MRIELPEKVKQIINRLAESGYEVYAVGGCVRDSILGRTPKDWDITTNASPDEVKSIFKKTIDTGIEHGTVTVLIDKEGFEVTTYRIDGKYEDNRHPSEVTFTRNLKDDLLRRDFTINAMAYNETDGLVDLFGGISDLEKGIIKAVGNPTERFDEDALRIMRAVRFAAELGFDIEEETFNAMSTFAPRLSGISAERIRVELQKLIMGPYPEKIKLAEKAGITAVVLPEWDEMSKTAQENPHHIYNVADHTLVSVMAMQRIIGVCGEDFTIDKNICTFGNRDILNEKLVDGNCSNRQSNKVGLDYGHRAGDKNINYRVLEENLKSVTLSNEKFSQKEKQILCLTMLMHDIGKPATKFIKNRVAHFYGHQKLSSKIAVEILQRLKYDNETIDMVGVLVKHHDDRFRMDWKEGGSDARKLAGKIGIDALRLLIPVQYADTLAQAPNCMKESFERIEIMRKLCDEISKEHQCVTLKDLAIKGKDLLEAGIEAGPEMGRILKRLLDEVIENPELNDKEYLMKKVSEYKKR